MIGTPKRDSSSPTPIPDTPAYIRKISRGRLRDGFWAFAFVANFAICYLIVRRHFDPTTPTPNVHNVNPQDMLLNGVVFFARLTNAIHMVVSGVDPSVYAKIARITHFLPVIMIGCLVVNIAINGWSAPQLVLDAVIIVVGMIPFWSVMPLSRTLIVSRTRTSNILREPYLIVAQIVSYLAVLQVHVVLLRLMLDRDYDFDSLSKFELFYLMLSMYWMSETVAYMLSIVSATASANSVYAGRPRAWKMFARRLPGMIGIAVQAGLLSAPTQIAALLRWFRVAETTKAGSGFRWITAQSDRVDFSVVYCGLYGVGFDEGIGRLAGRFNMMTKTGERAIEESRRVSKSAFQITFCIAFVGLYILETRVMDVLDGNDRHRWLIFCVTWFLCMSYRSMSSVIWTLGAAIGMCSCGSPIRNVALVKRDAHPSFGGQLASQARR